MPFDAPHATSFDLFQKLAADPTYNKVADDIIEKTFDTVKLDGGSTVDFKK